MKLSRNDILNVLNGKKISTRKNSNRSLRKNKSIDLRRKSLRRYGGDDETSKNSGIRVDIPGEKKEAQADAKVQEAQADAKVQDAEEKAMPPAEGTSKNTGVRVKEEDVTLIPGAANEVGANEVGANEVGANEVGANEVGANEIDASANVVDASANAVDANVVDASANEIGANEIDANAVDASANVVDASANEIGANAVDASANIVDASANIVDASANVVDASANAVDAEVKIDESAVSKDKRGSAVKTEVYTINIPIPGSKHNLNGKITFILPKNAVSGFGKNEGNHSKDVLNAFIQQSATVNPDADTSTADTCAADTSVRGEALALPHPVNPDADTSAADTSVTESKGEDTSAADTSAADTRGNPVNPDTSAADTSAADTSVADTSVADTTEETRGEEEQVLMERNVEELTKRVNDLEERNRQLQEQLDFANKEKQGVTVNENMLEDKRGVPVNDVTVEDEKEKSESTSSDGVNYEDNMLEDKRDVHVEETETKLKECEEGKTKLESEIADLKTKLEEAQNKIKEFEEGKTKLEEAQNKIKEFEEDKTKLESEIADLKTKLDAAEKQLNDINLSKVTDSEAKQKLDELIKNKDTEIAKLTEEKAALTSEKDKLTEEKAALDAEKAALTTEKEALTTEKSALTTELDELKTKISDSEKAKTDAEQMKKECDEKKVALETEKTALTTEKAKIEEEKAALTTEKATLTTEKANAEKELAEAKVKSDAEVAEAKAKADSEVADAKAKADAELADAKAKADAEKAKADAELAEAKSKAETELAEAKSKAETEKAKADAELAEAKTKIEEKDKKINETQEELNKVTTSKMSESEAKTLLETQIKQATEEKLQSDNKAKELADKAKAAEEALANKTKEAEDKAKAAEEALANKTKEVADKDVELNKAKELADKANEEATKAKELADKAKEEANKANEEATKAKADAEECEKKLAEKELVDNSEQAQKKREEEEKQKEVIIERIIKNMEMIQGKITDITKNISKIETENPEKFKKLDILIKQFKTYDNEFDTFKALQDCNDQNGFSKDRCSTTLKTASLRDIQKYNTEIETLLKNVINSSEDINGIVRIFVRVKGGGLKGDPKLPPLEYKVDEKDNIGNKKTLLEGKEYSPFYDVFSKDDNNENIFERIKPTLEQVNDGYHIALFGYGYSGSGKSYTLLNSKGTDIGVLIRAVGHYINKGLTVKVEKIRELYNNTYNPSRSDKDFDITNGLKDIVSEMNLQKNDALNIKTVETFNQLLQDIETYRKRIGRIKPTINNPDSSRGHLFITLKIGEKGYITVCDMAGREDPLEIWKNTKIDINTGAFSDNGIYVGSVSGRKDTTITGQSLRSIMIKGRIDETNIDKGVISKNFNLKEQAKQSLINVIETCKEAHYINETLNHMIYYFNDVKGIHTALKVGAYDSKENYMPENVIKDINDSAWKNKIGIIPVLEEIATVKEKPAKFCLFACVRQEADEKFKTASIKTLEYARDLAKVSKGQEEQKKLYSDVAKEVPYRTVPLKRKGGKTQRQGEKTQRIKHKKVNKTQKIKAKKNGDRRVRSVSTTTGAADRSVRSVSTTTGAADGTTTQLAQTEALQMALPEAKHDEALEALALPQAQQTEALQAQQIEAKQPAESKSIFNFFS